MLSALVILCAGAAASADPFYEPVDNVRARPFYKSPPPVTEYEYHPHSVVMTQTPRTPTKREPVPVLKPTMHMPLPVYKVEEHMPLPVYKVEEHLPLPVYKMAEHVPVPVYKPMEHVVSIPVHEAMEHVSLPVYKPTEHVFLPVYKPVEPKEHTPMSVYKPAEHVPEPAKNVPAPVFDKPQSTTSLPAYHQLSHHKQASSFQNVAYKVTQQAYRQVEEKPQNSSPYR